MAIKRLIFIILSVLVALSSFACKKEEKYVSYARTVFDSGIVFSVSMLGGDVDAAVDEMNGFLDAVNVVINLNDDNSQISRFNALSDGESMEVDYALFFLASEAQELYYQTNGAFHVGLSSVSAAWHVDAVGIANYGYPGAPDPVKLPSQEDLFALKGFTDMRGYECYTENGTYRLKKTLTEFKLDLGGIAKGYCADRCKEIAVKHGAQSALINISGNIVLVGDYRENGEAKPWGVGINNPKKDGEQYVCGLNLSGATVVTSGDYERNYDYTYPTGDDVRICHILDGNTLQPIGVEYDTDKARYKNVDHVTSATVIGESSMLADAYATAVCVMGIEDGAAFLKSVGYKGVIFTSDKHYTTVGELSFTPKQTLYVREYVKI